MASKGSTIVRRLGIILGIALAAAFAPVWLAASDAGEGARPPSSPPAVTATSHPASSRGASNPASTPASTPAPSSISVSNAVVAPTPSQPAISGTVVSAATGKPIAGARVVVYEQTDPEAARERRLRGQLVPDPIAQAAADTMGSFRLLVPPAVRVVVVAEAKGFARSVVPRPMALTHDRDLGTIELAAGRKVTGRVVDAAGKPVAGATVAAFTDAQRGRRAGAGASFIRRIVGDVPVPFPVIGQSSPDGSFVLEGVPQSAVSLRALADGLAPGLKEGVRATSGVTFKLTPGQPIKGRVVAPDGKSPVAGAWVMAGDDGWDGLTRSESDGTFTLRNLRSGTSSLTAIASTVRSTRTSAGEPGPPVEFSVAEGTLRDAGAVKASGGASAISAQAGKPSSRTSEKSSGTDTGPQRSTAAIGPEAFYAPSASTSVTVPPAPKAAAPVLKLRQGGIVRARVIDAETRDPLAGALLSLDAPGETQRRPGTTDAKGEAIFTGVPVGMVEVRAEAEGYLDENMPRVALAGGQARDVSAALRAGAAIEGTVRDSTGRPVVGATVSIAGPPPTPLPLPVFFPIGVDPVKSDAQGRFILEQLPPKVELKVSVASQAYAPWDTTGIRLRPGERRSGMEILLDAGLPIQGRLVDGDGKPVGFATITASRRPDEGPGGMVFRFGGGGGGRGAGGGGRGGMRAGAIGVESLPEVFPNPDGTFVIRGARPGVWTLDVESMGFAPKSVAGLKIDEAASHLEVGDVVLEPGVVLKGIVQSADGQPIPLARGRVSKEFSVLSEFITNEDGTFVSAALAPGSNVTLAIDAEGFAAAEKPGLTPPIEDLVITLAPSSNIRGRVVEKDSGRPVTDFGVTVTRSRSGGGGAMRMSMQVSGNEMPFHSEDGTFVLEDVDPGKVSVAARAPGYGEARLQDLEVPEGGDLEGVTLTLQRSASVSGVVNDDRGRPLPGATVEKKESSTGGFGDVRFMAGGRGRATTDGDGRFVLDGLDRARMTLSVSHADFEASDVDVDTAQDVENIRVSLSRGGSLFGIVMNEEDGSPIAKATVSATSAGSDRFFGGRSATTGPDGTFSIEGVSSGRYTLRAEAAGMRSAVAENVLVQSGAPAAPIELRMAGGVTIAGNVTGVKESDLPQFTVRVVGGRGAGLGKQAPVDATGRFEIKGLSPGTTTLMAGSGIFGGRTMAKTVEVPEGVASFETTIEFPRGNAVEGVVTRGESPVAGANVIFMNTAAMTSITATTDAGGKYRAEDLDDGDYNVTVMQIASSRSFSTKVSVEADKTFDIELPLAKLSGRVEDALSHEPLDGVSISIKKADAAPSMGGMGFIFQQGARTDATGLYEITGLEEGQYDVTVRKDGYAFDSKRVVIVPNLDAAEASFALSPTEGFSFVAMDSASGLPLKALEAVVLAGGGDALAPGGSGATVVFQGRLSADSSGAFRIGTVPPGKYCLVLGGQSVATETIYDVKVPSSQLTYTMVQGGTLAVTTTGLQQGQTARAALYTPDGRVAHAYTFPAESAFMLRSTAPLNLEDLKPGNYVLRAAMPNGTIEKAVTVTAGSETRVTVP